MGGIFLSGGGGSSFEGGDLLKGVFFRRGGIRGSCSEGGGVFRREADLLPFAADVALGLHPNSLCPLQHLLYPQYM